MKRNIILTLIMAAFMIGAWEGETTRAAIYYVSPSGNDTTGDGSSDNPWRTIQHAINQASSGDVIRVMGDGDDNTNDYSENVTVNKSLTIEAYSSTPQIVAANSDTDVIKVTADNVTIKGLEVHGATGSYNAGIYVLYDNFILQDNYSHDNYFGIYISGSHGQAYRNSCDENSNDGIYLDYSSHNRISSNCCSENGGNGITFYRSDDNFLIQNSCYGNTGRGIELIGSDGNLLAGNDLSENKDDGIRLTTFFDDGSDNNILVRNRCNQNGYENWDEFILQGSGIRIEDSSNNLVYLNMFSDNVLGEISLSGGSGNIFHSPTKLDYYYNNSSSDFKNFLGNYDSGSTGSDSNGDGIEDSSNDLGDVTDNYPLVKEPKYYALSQNWWLGNPVMYRDDMLQEIKTEALNGGGSLVWVADERTPSGVNFAAGDSAQGTSWTGQIAFTSAPANGNTFKVEIGYADPDGSNFTPGGPEVTLTGDGSKFLFPFTASAVAFSVPAGKNLALRLTNQSGSNYTVRVGGAWSYCSTSLNSQWYPGGDNITVYYVSPNGSDVSGLGTQAEPFRTIGRALAAASDGETIKVMDDDDSSTDDYVENLTVDKSVTIEAEDNDGTAPQVRSASFDKSVFTLKKSNVTIRGLDIYGATDEEKAGIYFDEDLISEITLQNNRCGWDASHQNYKGIYGYSSQGGNFSISNNTCSYNLDDGITIVGDNSTVTNNTTTYNGDDGIYVSGDNGAITNNTSTDNSGAGIYIHSSDNVNINGNTCNDNVWGIYLSYSDNNTVASNTCNNNQKVGICLSRSNDNVLSDNTCNSAKYDGIYISRGERNFISKNTCNLNKEAGIYLYNSRFTIVVKNTLSNNQNAEIYLSASDYNSIAWNTCSGAGGASQYGIYLTTSSNQNRIYFNQISDHTEANVKIVSSSDNTFYSPTKLGYNYNGSTVTSKNFMGNYYSDYTGGDTNGDGIGDSQYAGAGMTDPYPLKGTPDKYNLQVWWLTNPKMYRADMSHAPGTLTINGNSSQVWVADQAAPQEIKFEAGDPDANTSWTGRLSLTSTSYNLTIQIGYADSDGSNFSAVGPSTTVSTSSGSEDVLFTMPALSFTVPKGKYLALKITNNSSGGETIKLGGERSYCSAPQGSQDYSLPVTFSTVTAEVEDGKVLLRWTTASEVGNLGFNVWRGADRKGPFTKLNARLIKGSGDNPFPKEYSFTDEEVQSRRTYFYYIESVDIAGVKQRSQIIEVTVLPPPKETLLLQNYPNPFNPETWIPFQLSKDSSVVIRIYDLRGRLVRKLDLGL
ncbi:right-handed parallel beta-helix repeat-containing protein, partial [Candidatus Poribacteria bacterium]|nr:right-handed parallel beta-helix repeat-containing protein [Candidatus Poribacteria bacterium]